MPRTFFFVSFFQLKAYIKFLSSPHLLPHLLPSTNPSLAITLKTAATSQPNIKAKTPATSSKASPSFSDLHFHVLSQPKLPSPLFSTLPTVLTHPSPPPLNSAFFPSPAYVLPFSLSSTNQATNTRPSLSGKHQPSHYHFIFKHPPMFPEQHELVRRVFLEQKEMIWWAISEQQRGHRNGVGVGVVGEGEKDGHWGGGLGENRGGLEGGERMEVEQGERGRAKVAARWRSERVRLWERSAVRWMSKREGEA